MFAHGVDLIIREECLRSADLPARVGINVRT
jgi:hypothetical protein